MACSVTETQSHHEGRGGRSVTRVHVSVTKVHNKSVTGGGGERKKSGHRSVTGAWLHGLLECMVYS